MISTKQSYAQVFLRLALAGSMLSAVADRFGYWGSAAAWGNWSSFEEYTRTLTFFLPPLLSKAGAYVATCGEIVFSIFLVLGYKTRLTAYATTLLLMTFALTMTLALGPKAPLDYSVWTSIGAAFLLATQSEYTFSIDQLISKNK